MIIENVRIPGREGAFDVTVDDGKYSAIIPRSGPHQDVLLPGLVDLHTHLREPGGEVAETLDSGTRAAAAGGFTDVFAMANTSPTTDTVDRVREVRRRAENLAARVHVISAATYGLNGEEVVDVDALAAIGVRLFSDDGKCVNDDGLSWRLLQAMARNGTIFAQHAQSAPIVRDGVINERVADDLGVPGWPVAGEEAIIGRDIALAAATGGRLHVCHVSTRGSVELVRSAKERGLPITAEVTPHHLILTDHDAATAGPAFKVNPPLRSPDDVTAVREALKSGVIDVVATDHAPHPSHTKTCGWRDSAFGLTSLETALPIVAEVLEEDWTLIAEVMSFRPADIGGLTRHEIEVGHPATFCVVRPEPWTVGPQVSRSANTPFPARAFGHRVTLTVMDGRITHRA
ncbi:dihydroorotase [Herbidospora sp. RD11066]